MQWKLAEEQDDYREALRGWLEDVASPETVRGWLESGDAEAFEERLRRDGMGGVGIAEDLGGQGGGLVELALTAEELGRAGVPSASWLATVLAVPALESRPELVTAAVAGAPIALAVSAEHPPGAAAPLTLDADGQVSGVVQVVLAADRATGFVVPVIESSGPRLRWVSAGSEGVRIDPRRLLDRSRSVADLTFEAAPSEALDVDAVAALERSNDIAGVLLAADALGAMERMLDLAVDYSLQRQQFGVPIGSFQAVKHAAASILVDVEAGRSAVYYAAASVGSREEEHPLHAAAVKSQVTAAAARAADTSLTMHGAIGYTWEHDLHLFYKRARLDERLFGAPSSWNERIAERLL